ncbi:cyclic GMP-AMP synthase [Nephila pilipes]|uniref:Cyclic GMP-AMP synthase n=1 Tax=Nephila pilipes TaxID=299642 RepID=A0A8X6NJY2_NEPPI|nr:cyclic GMP-AMP synthase [Nephila pilipes]
MGSFWSSPEDTENQEKKDIKNQTQTMSFQPKKLRNPGVTYLKEILRGIKLDENLIKTNNEILKDFLSTFIEEMKKKDDIFKLLYQKPHFTGSFYSDLRISQPDEFDINLVLNLPFKASDFEITYHPQVPSYAKYHLKNPEAAAKAYPQLLKLLFQDGFLIPEKVRKWIQSVVDKALRTYSLRFPIVRIIPSASGPARTIKLMKYDGAVIDIDLVPTIPCVLESKQPGIDGRVRAKLGATLQTFLIPKPYSSTKQAPVNDTEISRLWRTHFPEAEGKLIHDIGCVKPVIKLLKLLRDRNVWKILASYYLKTVVMWMLIENSDKEYWKEDKMDERFIEALEKLAGYVEKQSIPYLFSKRNNLLSKIGPVEALNINKRLCSLIRDVKKDPFNFYKIFNVTPTFAIKNCL